MIDWIKEHVDDITITAVTVGAIAGIVTGNNPTLVLLMAIVIIYLKEIKEKINE